MNRNLTFLFLAVLLCLVPACSDHGHPHDEDGGHAHDDHDSADERPTVAVTHWTDRSELFMEYPVFVAGESGRSAIHVTDLTDFSPLSEGEAVVVLRAQDGRTLEFRDGPSRPGIFGVDLRVDRYFRVFENHRYPHIDPKASQDELTTEVETTGDEPFILHPGEFALGSTSERIRLPTDLVARLEGKSSLGRLGLLIHSTAGFVDAGWDGHLTLELSNVANLPITLYPGMKIGQISFLQMSTAADVPYGSAEVGSKSRASGARPPVATGRTSSGTDPPVRRWRDTVWRASRSPAGEVVYAAMLGGILGVVGEAELIAAIGVHEVDLAVPVALRDEGDHRHVR